MIFVAAIGKINPGSIKFNPETVTTNFLLQMTNGATKVTHSAGLEQYRLLQSISAGVEIMVLGTERQNGRRPVLESRVIMPIDSITIAERRLILSTIGQVFEAHL